MLGLLGVVTGSVLSFLLIGLGLIILYYAVFIHQFRDAVSGEYKESVAGDIIGLSIMLLGTFATGIVSIAVARRNVHLIKRFRRRNPVEDAESGQPSSRARDWIFGWLGVGAGLIALLVASVTGTALMVWLLWPFFTQGNPPSWVSADMQDYYRAIYEGRPPLHFVLDCMAVPLTVLLGFGLVRRGRRALNRYRGLPVGLSRRVSAAESESPVLWGSLRLVGGSTAVLVAAFWAVGLLYLGGAIYATRGTPPGWLPAQYHHDWSSTFEHGLSLDEGWGFELVFQPIGVTALLFLGAPLIRRGIQTIHGRMRSTRAMAAARG